MALMMVFALSFAACNDDEEQIPPTDGGNLTFEVTVGEITSSSIAYTVTPSDLKAEYLCILADAKTVESFTRDEFLVEAILEELKAEAGAQGKTLAEYMPEIVDKYNRGIQMYRFPNSDVQKSVIFEGIKKRLKIV